MKNTSPFLPARAVWLSKMVTNILPYLLPNKHRRPPPSIKQAAQHGASTPRPSPPPSSPPRSPPANSPSSSPPSPPHRPCPAAAADVSPPRSHSRSPPASARLSRWRGWSGGYCTVSKLPSAAAAVPVPGVGAVRAVSRAVLLALVLVLDDGVGVGLRPLNAPRRARGLGCAVRREPRRRGGSSLRSYDGVQH